MLKTPSSDVQNALFTYSSKPPFDYLDARGASIKRRVIRT
jgi:hypothetical protein